MLTLALLRGFNKNTSLHGLKGCVMAVWCIILGDQLLHIMYYKNPELIYKLFIIITKMKSIQLLIKQTNTAKVSRSINLVRN